MTIPDDPEELITYVNNLENTDEWKMNSGTIELGCEAILIVGSTKQGKSTFINCLLKNLLLCTFDEANEEWQLSNTDTFLQALLNAFYIENWRIKFNGFQVPKIKGAGESETLWPNLYKKDGIYIWDMPGLNDNRRADIELKQAAMAKLVITQNKAVSFVLVIDIDEIKSLNKMPLVESINLLLRYSPDIAHHLFIVISKSEKDNWMVLLEKFLQWNPSENNTNIDQINRAKKVIRIVINRNAGYSFKRPNFKDTNKTHYFKLNDGGLLNRINKIPKIGINNCQYVLKEEHFLKMRSNIKNINGIYAEKYSKLCDFFVSECATKLKAVEGTKEERINNLINFKENLPNEPVDYFKFLNYVLKHVEYEYDCFVRYGKFKNICKLIFEFQNDKEFETLIRKSIFELKSNIDTYCDDIRNESNCTIL